MSRFLLLFLLILFTSCDYFEKQKVYSEDLLEEELKTFNWNEVDIYPTFKSCDSITLKSDSKRCFQNTLIMHVNQFLEQQNLVVSNDINDTIRLKIVINKQGVLEVASISLKEETRQEIPELDSLLRQSLKMVPKIFPAIKRRQQVTTAFELPIIVTIN
ncbi:hypothetical protein [uncultured Winogradskyella sp.]|uniref:hypothetical protein n=1 Tax=uncultured Winogradskyella sp. TaxID=395353 RepID=UPI0030DB9C5E|tara:strand:+ start:152 stop:628 length:477 start_codon:yes stop_codon:yes gene_type:complete